MKSPWKTAFGVFSGRPYPRRSSAGGRSQKEEDGPPGRSARRHLRSSGSGTPAGEEAAGEGAAAPRRRPRRLLGPSARRPSSRGRRRRACRAPPGRPLEPRGSPGCVSGRPPESASAGTGQPSPAGWRRCCHRDAPRRDEGLAARLRRLLLPIARRAEATCGCSPRDGADDARGPASARRGAAPGRARPAPSRAAPALGQVKGRASAPMIYMHRGTDTAACRAPVSKPV